jgi:hypothetical protein
MTSVISTEAPAEMFRELVEGALDHQKVETSEDSAAYLVSLLDSFVRPDGRYEAAGASPDRPLAEILLAASQSRSAHSVTSLRFVGDLALFLVGFYADGLRHAIAGPSCYIRLGGSAYGVLARSTAVAGAAALFNELATNFVRFADVLNEVSEKCSLADTADLLRLYETWQQTRSRRSASLLRAQGVLLVPAPDAVH